MKDLIKLLKEKHLTISSIESFTGGLFASEITAIPGASKVYVGTLVSYDTKIKRDILKIDDVIDRFGVISKECAIALASNGNKYFKTDLCVSFTGNAGPDVMENKKAGLVYMAIDYQGKQYVFEDNYNCERNEIRIKSVEKAIQRLINIILG